MFSPKDEAQFARETLRAYMLYLELASREPAGSFQDLLTAMAHTAKDQFDFWALKTGVRGDTVRLPWHMRVGYRIMRKCLGLAFTARVISGKKERRIEDYKQYCTTCTADEDHRIIDAFVLRMQALVDQLRTVPSL